MKAAFAMLAVVWATAAKCTSQIITTVAGTGVAGCSGDGGPATLAQTSAPWGLVCDATGGLYIADFDCHTIRYIDPSGNIHLYAGTGSAGFSGDGGAATAAQLNMPAGIIVDPLNNIYLSEFANYRIRKIAYTGIITTFAGDGVPGSTGDGGPATSAHIVPGALSIDTGGILYFAAQNSVRKIDLTGIITTVAGTGSSGYSGDGGPATSALFNTIQGMDVDNAGNIYIADRFNYRIRRISTAGVVTTICGDGVMTNTGDGGPASAARIGLVHGLKCDAAGNIYLACDESRVRRISSNGIITTIAGTGTLGFSGDGGPATTANIASPYCLALDCPGNLYFGETVTGYNRIRKIVPQVLSPTFTTGGETVMHTCMATPFALDTLLKITDGNEGQTITWSLLAPPAHGVASVSCQRVSNGGTLYPFGLYYMPGSGFNGTDAFTVLAGDCAGQSDTLAITIVVDTIPSSGTLTGADTICEGESTPFLSTLGGGIWSSSNLSVATVSSSGVVAGVSSGTATVTYTVTNACGSAASYHSVTILPSAQCPTHASEINLDQQVFVSPNPSSGSVMVTLPDKTPAHIRIFDVTGRQVMARSCMGTSAIFLESNNGLYFFEIEVGCALIHRMVHLQR